MFLSAAFPHGAFAEVLSRDLGRLLLAAVLGGVVGVERELKHRPAGLRTNMFICFGAAMFTVLSLQLASPGGGEQARIASQIIPGIGFIGAGSILHAQRTITGLTTAATIFVVAAIGMACGGGLYGLAVFASVLILICLQVLGTLERRFNLKSSLMHYSITTERSADDITQEIDGLLEEHGRHVEALKLVRINGKKKIIFTVDGTRTEHDEFMASLRQSEDLKNFQAVRGHDTD